MRRDRTVLQMLQLRLADTEAWLRQQQQRETRRHAYLDRICTQYGVPSVWATQRQAEEAAEACYSTRAARCVLEAYER